MLISLLLVFAYQSSLDDSNASLPDTIPVPQSVTEPKTFTATEVESVLKYFKTGRRPGRPTYLDDSRARTYCACNRSG